MTNSHADPELDALVTALVDWGATASQIVSHMEHVKASGESTASASTVDVFRTLLGVILAPVLSDHPADQIGDAAALVEQVNGAVLTGVLLVPVEELKAARDPKF